MKRVYGGGGGGVKHRTEKNIIVFFAIPSLRLTLQWTNQYKYFSPYVLLKNKEKNHMNMHLHKPNENNHRQPIQVKRWR